MSEQQTGADAPDNTEPQTPEALDRKAAEELIRSRQKAKERARALEAKAAELEARLAQFESQEKAKEQQDLEAKGAYEKAKAVYDQRIAQLSEQLESFKRLESEREARRLR
jgi:hypothetical protein